jgi:hypothetical protein
MTTLEQPLYSPDLAPADFYLFPRLKSALKGWALLWCYIIKNALDELKKFSRKGFQEFYQHLYSRWQMCVAEQEEYYGRNVA